jgi:hypothetical protein
MIYFLWYVALSYPFCFVWMYIERRDLVDMNDEDICCMFLLSPILPALAVYLKFFNFLSRIIARLLRRR